MLKKYIGLVAAAGLAGTVALACSSTTTTTGSSSSGGATDSGTTDAKRDVTPPKDGGTGTCYDSANAKQFATAAPKAGQNACTGTMAADFLAACLGTGSDQAKCDAFIKDATKKACTTCLLGPQQGDDPKIIPQPVLISVGDSVFLNVGACENLAVAAPADCAKKAGDEALCLLTTCETCETADRTACINDSATKDPCKGALAGKVCDDAVTAGQAAADAKCGAVSGAKFEDIYAKMAAYMCGPPG